MFQNAAFMKDYVLNEQNDTQVLFEYFLRILTCESEQINVKDKQKCLQNIISTCIDNKDELQSKKITMTQNNETSPQRICNNNKMVNNNTVKYNDVYGGNNKPIQNSENKHKNSAKFQPCIDIEFNRIDIKEHNCKQSIIKHKLSSNTAKEHTKHKDEPKNMCSNKQIVARQKTDKHYNKSFKDKFNITYTEKHKLKCGHTRKIKNTENILILRLNKKISLQKCINDLCKPRKEANKMVLCYNCVRKIRVEVFYIRINKLPKCIFLEIERGYIKNNKLTFYDKQIKVNSILQIKNTLFSVNSAILYRNNHYTTIVQKNKQYFYIDNNTYKTITILQAIKEIEMYGRLIVCIKQKNVNKTNTQ
ncbi:hypothetical protein BDAP_000735 [Binucleata daphniae]